MERLINASDLANYCNNLKAKTVDANDIMRFPAIDAVPVVRCGECRHRLGCLISDGPDGRKDWFCADGEREEQERIEL